MKNNLFVLFSILLVSNTFSQTVFSMKKFDTKSKPKYTYFQFDITLALKGNPNAGETNEYSQKKESWFLPDGLDSKIGYGLHYNKWVALGIHTGINWEWENKLVVAPIFANFKLSPKISISPAEGVIKESNIRIVVDLPAPFCPRKPYTSPSFT